MVFCLFFSWPIVWHILSIIYHDPSCFSYLKLGGQSVWARDSRNMTDYFWLFLPRKFWCQILLGGFGALEQALQNSEKSFSTPSLPSKLLVVQLHSTQQYSKIWTMLEAVQISCCILERKLMEVENMKKVLLLLLGLFLSRKRRKQILFCFFHFGKEKKAKFIGFAQKKRSPVKLTVNLEFEGTDLLFPALYCSF